jgi:hypothetical protein
VNDTIDGLILVQVASSGTKGCTAAAVESFLTSLLVDRPPAEAAQLVRHRTAALTAGGLVRLAKRRLVATASGKERAAAYLGITGRQLPSSWAQARDAHLVAMALSLAVDRKGLARLGTPAGLRAEILRREYSLPLGAAPDMAEVKHALAWRLLPRGAAAQVVARVASTQFTLQAALAALVSSALGEDATNELDKDLGLLAARALGTGTSPEEMRAAIHRRLVGTEGAAGTDAPGGDHVAPADAAATGGESDGEDRPSHEVFAARVLASARRAQGGWYGENKVFINHVHRQFMHDNPAEGMSLGTFKTRLLEANQAGALSLSRADLVPAMDRADLEESEIEFLTASFHFIRV